MVCTETVSAIAGTCVIKGAGPAHHGVSPSLYFKALHIG